MNKLVLAQSKFSSRRISMACDKSNSVCSSKAAHVHKITHELSAENNFTEDHRTILRKIRIQ